MYRLVIEITANDADEARAIAQAIVRNAPAVAEEDGKVVGWYPNTLKPCEARLYEDGVQIAPQVRWYPTLDFEAMEHEAIEAATGGGETE